MKRKWISLVLMAAVLLGTIVPKQEFLAKEAESAEEVLTVGTEAETETERIPAETELIPAEIELIPKEAEAVEIKNTVPEPVSARETQDYVIGRPLTEEEKAAERALEPKLSDLPEDSYDIPEIADEIDALGTENPLEEDTKFYEILRKDAGIDTYGTVGLEAKYDIRQSGGITPVRQQRGETCWAFSSIAAGEQSLLAKGASLKDGSVSPLTLDLSEAQMTYYFYHPVADPLGNTRGDGNYNISSQSYLNVGSSTIFSTFELAGWVGAVKEADMSLHDLYSEKTFQDSMAFENNAAHLQNAYWINFKDTDAVNSAKQMVKQYGAVAINMYYSYNYYNSDTKAYYYPLNPGRGNNHSVTLVGWDDSYKKENFGLSAQPSTDGAWIVKNSYGPDWGDKGYFYLSYEDSAVNTNNTNVNRARAFVYDFESADNYANNYQYDGTAGAYNCSNAASTKTRVENGGSVANVYQVSEDTPSKYETLKAVSFALYDTAVNYSIQIYKNPNDMANPASGTAMLKTPKTGATSYVGYYTVKLDQDILLQGGDTFAVVVTFSKESGNDINFFVDATYSNGGWVSFVNKVNQGQSLKLSGGRWQDLYAEGMTARIKAFTDDYVIPAQKIALEPMEGLIQDADGSYSLTVYSNRTYRLMADIFPEDASYQELDWASSEESVLKVDQEGNIIPVSAGTTVITGMAKDGTNLSLKIKTEVIISAESFRISKKELTLKQGEQQALTAEILPENAKDLQISWESSDDKVAKVSKKGLVQALHPGKAVITAKLSDGSGLSADCRVTVTKSDTGSSEEGTTVDQENTADDGTIDATGKETHRTKVAWTGDGAPVEALIIIGILSAVYVLWRIKKSNFQK